MAFSWSPFSQANLVPVTQPVAVAQQVQQVPVQRVIYEPAPAPTTTTTTVTTAAAPTIAPTTFNACHMRFYGLILALLAATTLALGIADVVTTYYNYNCAAVPSPCSVTNEPWVWTWVASAIWGSIPLFLAGLIAMCLGRNPARWIRLFALLIFLSAVVFAPAILILTAIELWRGSAAFYTAAIAAGTVTAVPAATGAVSTKFGLPLAIVILAAIMWIMTAVMMMALCCCTHWLGIYYQSAPAAAAIVEVPKPLPPAPAPVPVVQQEYFYYPARPQIKPAPILYQPAGPYLPTRYNSVMPGLYSSGAVYGNFPARPAAVPQSSFLGDFFSS